jgi:hypothetical protein
VKVEKPPALTIAQFATDNSAPSTWRREAREATLQGRGADPWNTLPSTREYGPRDAEDHVAQQSEAEGGSIAVAMTLPGRPDESVMRQGFWPATPRAAELASDAALPAAPDPFPDPPPLPPVVPLPPQPITLEGEHAAAYDEFQLAAAALEAATRAMLAAQQRYQAAIAKLSPLAAKTQRA